MLSLFHFLLTLRPWEMYGGMKSTEESSILYFLLPDFLNEKIIFSPCWASEEFSPSLEDDTLKELAGTEQWGDRVQN